MSLSIANKPEATVWVDNAKIIAIVAVVLLHVGVVVLQHQAVGSPSWWVASLLSSAGRWGVPIFVVVSGATLLGLGKTEPAKIFYRKRMARILTPLLFWSAFYILWVATRLLLKGEAVDWADLTFNWALGRPTYHLWFMYMILGLYMIVPWMRLAMQDMSALMLLNSWRIMLLIVAADLFARQLGMSKGPQWFPLWFVEYIPLFLLGAYAMRHMNGIAGRTPGKWLMMVVAAVALVLGYPVLMVNGMKSWAMYWHENLGLAIVLMTLTLIPLLRGWSKPLFGASNAKVASLTFGIYLIHMFVLSCLMRTHWHHDALGAIESLTLIGLWTIATLLISSGLVLIMSRLPLLRNVV